VGPTDGPADETSAHDGPSVIEADAGASDSAAAGMQLVCDSGGAPAPADAGPLIPPSCQGGGPGVSDCGSTRESCCLSPLVPGGTFFRGYDEAVFGGVVLMLADGGPAVGETAPATVSSFRLDKYDVTVGRFRPFVSAWKAGWRPQAGSGKHAHVNCGYGLANVGSAGGYETGWKESDNVWVAPIDGNLLSCVPAFRYPTDATWTTSPGGQENLPLSCVNWYEAYAFCVWDGGFLPSEAEWGYAAAGGNQQREYPWGATDPGSANQYAIYNCYYPSQTGMCAGTLQNIAPVGTASLGAGLWGQLDLVGNLYQWGLDTFSGHIYDASAFITYAQPCVDCVFLESVGERVSRGASFVSAKYNLIPSGRPALDPTKRYDVGGFRCARAP
jgi:formylglycine-generating enzyme required for sulfatase activity